MKKLAYVFLLVFSMTAFAQQGRNAPPDKDFTPEQQAVLKTKKMALALDLTEAQQKQILEINKKWAAKKEKHRAEMKALFAEGSNPTDEQKFAKKNEMLDMQLAYQKELKGVLNEEQYNAWKETGNRHHGHGMPCKGGECKEMRARKGR